MPSIARRAASRWPKGRSSRPADIGGGGRQQPSPHSQPMQPVSAPAQFSPRTCPSSPRQPPPLETIAMPAPVCCSGRRRPKRPAMSAAMPAMPSPPPSPLRPTSPSVPRQRLHPHHRERGVALHHRPPLRRDGAGDRPGQRLLLARQDLRRPEDHHPRPCRLLGRPRRPQVAPIALARSRTSHGRQPAPSPLPCRMRRAAKCHCRPPAAAHAASQSPQPCQAAGRRSRARSRRQQPAVRSRPPARAGDVGRRQVPLAGQRQGHRRFRRVQGHRHQHRGAGGPPVRPPKTAR